MNPRQVRIVALVLVAILVLGAAATLLGRRNGQIAAARAGGGVAHEGVHRRGIHRRVRVRGDRPRPGVVAQRERPRHLVGEAAVQAPGGVGLQEVVHLHAAVRAQAAGPGRDVELRIDHQ